MKEAIGEGLDFNLVIHETLEEVLGSWSSQQFFSSTGTSTTTPESFVEIAKRIFPDRALMVIFDMAAKKASAWVLSSTYGEESRFQKMMRALYDEVGEGSDAKKSTPLHDHRAEDDLDKAVGHRTT
jgi:hypothetical protein